MSLVKGLGHPLTYMRKTTEDARARERAIARERRDKDVYTKIHLAILGDSLQDDVSLIDEALVSIL